MSTLNKMIEVDYDALNPRIKQFQIVEKNFETKHKVFYSGLALIIYLVSLCLRLLEHTDLLSYLMCHFGTSILYITWVARDTYSQNLYDKLKILSPKYDNYLWILCERYASQFNFRQHYIYVYLHDKARIIHNVTVIIINTLLYGIYLMQLGGLK